MGGLLVGVGVLAVGTYLIRVAGPVLRSRVQVSESAQRVMDRAAVALLVAVALTGAWFVGDEFAGWPRPAGVGVGVVAALLKAPLVAIVVLAAVTTAGLRLLGVQ